jgi:hypothetical protein
MPALPVVCSIAGFEPAATPIQWRLVCRHVLCRYCNQGSYQYKSAFDVFDREWRGESTAANFTILDGTSTQCSCTYNDQSHLLGGHGILQVAVSVDGALITDFVHLRIGAANPTQADVLGYLNTQLGAYDPNVASMVRAIFAHESGYRQFATGTQSKTAMTFSYARGFHHDSTQPDCPVSFEWPADPANFPMVSFDYGVGISQYTRVAGQTITSDMAWDWRENIRTGVNLFIANKLKPRFKPGMTWQQWANVSWAAYNGSGPAAQQYAQTLAASVDGQKLSSQPVPTGVEVAALKAPAPLPDPGPWGPLGASAVSA